METNLNPHRNISIGELDFDFKAFFFLTDKTSLLFRENKEKLTAYFQERKAANIHPLLLHTNQ